MTGYGRQIVKKVFTMTLTASMAIGFSGAGTISAFAASGSPSAGSASDTVKAVEHALHREELSAENVIGDLNEDKNSFHQENEDLRIEIPKDPDDGIMMDTMDSHSITMQLPKEVSGEKGEMKDGTLVYDSDDADVSVAVQAAAYDRYPKDRALDDQADTVRSLIVIGSADAPKDYSFKFRLGRNQSLKKGPGGLVFIMENGESAYEIMPAWAKDAKGNDVKSYYTIKGKTLIQHVSFDENTQFPVVADPAMSGYYYKKSNVSVNYEYGKWKRTSSIMNTKKTKGGTLTVNESYTISGSVSGNIKGIVTIGTGSSITSATSRSWSIAKNKRCYAECRAEFKVERGTRKKISMNTGKVVSKNSYTVKRPRGKYYREYRVHYL